MNFDTLKRQLERIAIHDPHAERRLKNEKLRAGAKGCEACGDPVDGTTRCRSCTWFFDPDYDEISRFVSINPEKRTVSFKSHSSAAFRVHFSISRSVESAISLLDANQKYLDVFLDLEDDSRLISALDTLEDFIIENVPFFAIPEDYMEDTFIAEDFLKFQNAEAMAAYWVAMASDTCIIHIDDMTQYLVEQAQIEIQEASEYFANELRVWLGGMVI